MEKYLDVTKEQFKGFMQLKIDEPLFMLNLLKFKKHVVENGLSGKKQYHNYMKATQPFFAKAKASVVFYGEPIFTIIGPNDGNEWDKILIVKYDKKEDFVNMITKEGYPSEMRKLALEDSRLMFCSSYL